MSKLNKSEMALFSEYKLDIIPPFQYHIYKTGTIKRGDLLYKSTLFYPQKLYYGKERGRVLYYDSNSSLKELLDNTIVKYNVRMKHPVSDVWYEHDGYYIKGYRIYNDVYGNSYIFLSDSDQKKIYCYPNGDICIFDDDTRIVIANSIELWNKFKQSPKYSIIYEIKYGKYGKIFLFTVYSLIIFLLIFCIVGL